MKSGFWVPQSDSDVAQVNPTGQNPKFEWIIYFCKNIAFVD